MNFILIILIFILITILIPLGITYFILNKIKQKKWYAYLTLFPFFSYVSFFIYAVLGLLDIDLGFFKYDGEVFGLETLFIMYYYITLIPFIILFIMSAIIWIYKSFKK